MKTIEMKIAIKIWHRTSGSLNDMPRRLIRSPYRSATDCAHIIVREDKNKIVSFKMVLFIVNLFPLLSL